MLLIGSHVSFKSNTQLLGSTKEALSYGENAFMFYTGAPQNTKRSKIDDNLTNEALKLMKESNIDIKNVIVHAPYIINLANDENKEKYLFAIDFLKEEIKRVEKFGVKKIVLHPGSYTTLDIDRGIKCIINALNEVLKDESNVSILLETMAGKGTEIGFKLEHLKRIIDGVNNSQRLMVCLDTCHLNDAGYDMSNFDDFLDGFDNIIGIEKVGCIHINDSKNILSSNKDRHENIGYGTIGFENLINIIYNERLKDVPKILETPFVKDRLYPPYKFEIDEIKNKKLNSNLYEDIINYYEKKVIDLYYFVYYFYYFF